MVDLAKHIHKVSGIWSIIRYVRKYINIWIGC
jgi:hypothetical protein